MSVHASPIAQGVPPLLCSAAFLLKTLERFKWAQMKACKAIYATKTLSLRSHFRYLYSSVFDWIHYLLIYLICSSSAFAAFIWLLPSIPIFNHRSHCNCQTGNLTQKNKGHMGDLWPLYLSGNLGSALCVSVFVWVFVHMKWKSLVSSSADFLFPHKLKDYRLLHMFVKLPSAWLHTLFTLPETDEASQINLWEWLGTKAAKN